LSITSLFSFRGTGAANSWVIRPERDVCNLVHVIIAIHQPREDMERGLLWSGRAVQSPAGRHTHARKWPCGGATRDPAMGPLDRLVPQSSNCTPFIFLLAMFFNLRLHPFGTGRVSILKVTLSIPNYKTFQKFWRVKGSKV
jgi:hypothetical protein